MTESFKIVRDGQGMGNSLCPPGHPGHFYVVKGSQGSMLGLEYAVRDERGVVPPAFKAEVQKLLDAADLVYSEAWQRYVYGYYHNCYAPTSGSLNIADVVFPQPGDETPPPTRHLGYLEVKEYFRDHEPRLDLIANGGNRGTTLCVKCGETVQYEPRFDGWAKVSADGWASVPDCPKGGNHEVTE